MLDKLKKIIAGRGDEFITIDDNEEYGYTIYIDNKVYSNYLSYAEAENELISLAKGYELGRLSMKGKMSW